MGREIELKIPLKVEEFETIFSIIHSGKNHKGIKFSTVEKLYKQDEYYSLYDSRAERIENGEPQVIRIRVEDNGSEKKAYFTLKRKTKQNGIELNKEDESFVSDPDVIRDILTLSKYKCWFRKEKQAYSVHCNSDVLSDVDFHLELEKVNELPYIEVEVTEEHQNADVVKAALGEFVKLFGLNPENKDSRSWVEIING